MRTLLARLRNSDDRACSCSPSFEGDHLVVDAADCPGSGVLTDHAACRATAVEALTERTADTVITRSHGVERAYEGRAAALLEAAGRFAERVAFHDDYLAERAKTDPLAAARAAIGRAGAVADLAAETAFTACADGADSYEDVLAPFVGPSIARSRVTLSPPSEAVLDAERTLETDATIRIYDQPDTELRTYHLEPIEHTLDETALATLATAHDVLAEGGVSGGDRAPGRAVRSVADSDVSTATLTDVLRKHTRGYGVLEDLFADPAVSDVFATAPVTENCLRAVVDGESMRTNVRLTESGARTLASRFRRASGRAFSRANPTLDAVADAGTAGGVRVAGVTEPVSDGVAFAFRAHDTEPWTLPALVSNGTLSADAAAVLSVAIERSAASLVAGARGAGKTTLLGALLWELPAATRTVVIEDTPELPVDALQREGRDVQPLRTAVDDGPGIEPADALRTALRLGEGALVLGEIRGEEARVLYEAMRVGASGSAVLGTVHGDDAASVRERVVTDLGVAPSAFAATDVVISLKSRATETGRERRVASIEEVVGRGESARFEQLYDFDDGSLVSTGRIDRGNSELVASLAASGESYADVRAALDSRTEFLATLAAEGRTTATDVVRAHARRRTGDGLC